MNLTGAMLVTQAALPSLLERRGGVVMFMGSQLGHVAAPGRAAYGATKAALMHLARALAVEHGADGLRALSLSPGAVLTERLVARYGSSEAAEGGAGGSATRRGRLGTAEEIAATAAFPVQR